MLARSSPAFEHGAALRVPPAHDTAQWGKFVWWLGSAGRSTDQVGRIDVLTPGGWQEARPGDWVILSVTGRYFLAPARDPV